MRARESVRAEGGNEADHIIEMELKPEELDRLTGAQAAPACSDVMAARSSQGRSQGGSSYSVARMALPLCVSIGAALLAFGATRVARVRAPPVAPIVTAAPIERAAVAPVAPPVRFVNPFDASEVFEFPAGTTRTEAHDQVAKILFERAHARLELRMAKRSRHRGPPLPVSAREPAASGAAGQ